MIVPSIDIMDGHAVQLVGGREKKIDAGDPMPIAAKFGLVNEIAVVDLDAALGRGSNEELIRKLVRSTPCRVCGGIRDAEAAIRWLDEGAVQVVIGTAARPEVLRQLPKKRVVAALDAFNDDIVIEGWRTKTGKRVADRMKELRELVGGFLVTFVEREGRMVGIDPQRVKELVEAAGDVKLTVAGGVSDAEDIAMIDSIGADAQVGMAIYSGKLGLAQAFAAPLKSDREDGLWPTVVCDEQGIALGLAYSNRESLSEAIESRRGVYHSRKRGLWVKGLTSGSTQKLLRVSADCDRDTLRFVVRQQGEGFCHLGSRSCWGEDWGLGRLQRRLAKRIADAPEGSYTKRLIEDPTLLRSKLLEEAGELSDAEGKDEIIWEAADVIYFTLVAMAKEGVSLSEVESELERRSLKVTRRKGDAKPEIER